VLVDLGIDVAVDHHEVFPAVVVEVEEAHAPADEGNRYLRDAGLIADFGKACIAVISIERLVVVGEIGDKQVDEAVVEVVACGEAMDAISRPSRLSAKPEI